MRMAATRWRSFINWLGFDIHSKNQGPLRFLLPVARQTAWVVSPWLESLLAERERRGLAWSVGRDQSQLAIDLQVQPLQKSDAERDVFWLIWLLEGDFGRLARLAEAPDDLMRRTGWTPRQVRYWALAVALARLGLGYQVLVRRVGAGSAQQAWEAAAKRAWLASSQISRMSA
jgi:hypothetical protein